VAANYVPKTCCCLQPSRAVSAGRDAANEKCSSIEGERNRFKIERDNVEHNQEQWHKDQQFLVKGYGDLDTELTAYKERVNLLTAIVRGAVNHGRSRLFNSRTLANVLD
jgi:hypothetical protein